MNTIGVFFESKEKRHAAAPDFSGKFTLTEPFLKACVEAWRAHRAAGTAGVCEARIEGRWKPGQAVKFLSLNVMPPKAGE